MYRDFLINLKTALESAYLDNDLQVPQVYYEVLSRLDNLNNDSNTEHGELMITFLKDKVDDIHRTRVAVVLADLHSLYPEIADECAQTWADTFVRMGGLEELNEAFSYKDEVQHREMPPCQE